MEATVKLYTYGYREVRTYVMACLFVLGNVVLPQLFHLIPQGGIIWLPIYFFTLVGAYKYGWKVGLLTAIASPLVNSWFFGMPAPAVLPAILTKSLLLAVAAGFAGLPDRSAGYAAAGCRWLLGTSSYHAKIKCLCGKERYGCLHWWPLCC